MFFPVARFHIIRYIVHRTPGQLKVIRQERGRKRQFKVNRPANEAIAGLCREKVYTGLYCCFPEIPVDRFPGNQSEVYNPVAFVVDSLNSNDILSRMKSLGSITGKRNQTVILRRGAGKRPDTVYINICGIIISDFKKHILSRNIVR